MEFSASQTEAYDASAPFFSILLPSRNRLDLLRRAVETVLLQEFLQFEVVISDNASTEDYAEYVRSLEDERVRLVRSETPLHVTENWNRALDASRGSYAIMLGDDDGLTPGYLASAKRLIEEFDRPDAMYVMAYHYGYPDTLPNNKAGYLTSVHYDSMGAGFERPFLLDISRARLLGRQGLRIHNLFGFNSQHFIWKRDFIDGLKAFGPFFQSPYPDFYSSLITMLTAERIVVDPEPRAIIGISPKSFGFYFTNKQIDRGNAMLMLDEAAAEGARGDSKEISSALALPGSSHFRNWFIAALSVWRNLGGGNHLPIDIRRYRMIQIYFGLHQLMFGDAHSGVSLDRLRPLLDPQERQFAATALRFLRNFKKLPAGASRKAPISLEHVMRIHTQPRFCRYNIGLHRDISDVWRALKETEGRPPLSRDTSLFRSLRRFLSVRRRR